MRLNSILAQQKAAIIKKWFALILETYPEDTASFLKDQKDPFANPVGSAIREGIEGLFEEFLQPVPSVNLAPFLDKVIRIRAVQDFSPSGTVSFIFSFKGYAA